MSNSTGHRKLAAIMFTDMVGYRGLTQRDEALALELLEEDRRLVRDTLPQHGGREVKPTGHGFLIEFSSALAAGRAGRFTHPAAADLPHFLPSIRSRESEVWYTSASG